MEEAFNQFRPLTEESLKQLHILNLESIKKRKEEKKLLREEEKLKKHEHGKDNSSKRKPLSKIQPDKRLEAGKVLPHYLGDYFPKKKLAGMMLEEIDPYHKNTFIVINGSKTIFRFSSTNAFFIFSPFNPIRAAAIKILTHSLFSFCVLTTIIVNCVLMAQNTDSDVVEIIFTAIYTAEFIIKALARGLIIFQFTYLRDAWNWLDFIVIGLAYMMYGYPALGKLSALRSLRVLRALKTVTTIPGMKTVVSSLLMAITKLRDALVLTVFMLSIFALIGLQLYRGTLLQKCVKPFENSTYEEEVLENDTIITWEIKMKYFNDKGKCFVYRSFSRSEKLNSVDKK